MPPEGDDDEELPPEPEEDEEGSEDEVDELGEESFPASDPPPISGLR